MKSTIFILFIFCLFMSFKAFAGGPGDYAPAIKKQAEAMGQALMKNDYVTYMKYTDPRVIKEMGGETAFSDTLQRYAGQRKHYGMKIYEIDVQDPSWVLDTAGELQTAVPVSSEMKVKEGLVTTLTTFIGISKDKGKTWVFMDTQEGIQAIRMKYKDISSKLPVPAPVAPTFQSN